MSTSAPPFVTSGPYPVRSGNAVELLLDGEAAFRRLCKAIEAAQHSIWATITFMWPEFRMPDGRGTALEVLDQAAQRGVDVRLIFWRPDEETANLRRNAFWGSAEHFGLLERLQPRVKIRWDRAEPGFCQHQKSWLVDAGHQGQVAFLGGLNLNPHSLVAPGHRGEGQNHDLYIELSGPAVADVHHNFVQRWNEASERHEKDGLWGEKAGSELEFPTVLPAECGTVMVQIQRTLHPGRYTHGQAAVGAASFDIAAGERSNFQQYVAAIRAARRSIYLEQQYLENHALVETLHGTLARGVEVVVLLPLKPDLQSLANTTAERRAFLEARAALAEYPNFTLAGLAGLGDDGQRKPVWIHSKLMLIDDTWANIGSANLHRFSLFGNAELNAAMHSAETVQAMRTALFQEHLAQDTSMLDDLAALRLFRQVAQANREKFQRSDHNWQGIAVETDMAMYGLVSPPGW